MYSEAETYYRIRLPQTQPIKRPQLLSSVTTRGAEKLWVNGKGVISAPINRQLATDKITRCRHQDGAYSTKYALFFSYILAKKKKKISPTSWAISRF